MSPLYEFKCDKCNKEFEAVAPVGTEEYECGCGATASKQISAPGGYRMNGGNGASTTPKSAGSFFKKGK